MGKLPVINIMPQFESYDPFSLILIRWNLNPQAMILESRGFQGVIHGYGLSGEGLVPFKERPTAPIP